MVHNYYRSSNPSGENVSTDLERALLADAGHEVELFGLRSDDFVTGPGGEGGPGLRVGLASIYNRSVAAHLERLLARFRPDVVHVQNTHPFVSWSILGPLREARAGCVVSLRNYRLICPVATLWRDGAPCHECVGHVVPTAATRHRCLDGSVARSAHATVQSRLPTWRGMWDAVDLFVATSAHVRDVYAASGLPADRIVVRPNIVPLTRPVGVGRRDRTGFLYAGRLEDAKGVRVLLDAALRCRDDSGLDTVLIAGGGPLADELSAHPAVAAGAVELLGRLTYDETRRHMATVRAVVVPSLWQEPFGRVCVEAQALGTPVIASAVGGMPDLVADGRTGLLVPPGDAGALRSALRRLQDDDLVASLGAAATAEPRLSTDPQAFLAATLELYRQAQARAAHAGLVSV